MAVQAGLILVTGAAGFVGLALVRSLAIANSQRNVRAAVRQSCVEWAEAVQSVSVGDLSADTDWFSALRGVSDVVHVAARVHVMQDTAADPLTEFRRTNVEGTLALARQAALAGVRRFVFICSIKVNGEATASGRPFTAEDAPKPQDPYGISKMEAEQGLRQIAAETGMEVVVIRPPLVYGTGVRANVRALLRAVARGLPLPLGAVDNHRSMVALDNLVNFMLVCLNHPAAANQAFLVSDGEDLSTAELVRRMGLAMGKPARLIPVPIWLLQAGAALLGRRDVVQRLCGSLQLDIHKNRELLGWVPVIGVDEGSRRTVAGWQR